VSTEHSQSPISPGHETSDAHVKGVLMTGIGLLGIMMLGLVLSWAVYSFFVQRTSVPGLHAETLTRPDLTRLAPGPHLEADPHASLVVFRHAEDSIMAGYAWVNRDSGIVRIPVERAMQLLVEKGLPRQPEGK